MNNLDRFQEKNKLRANSSNKINSHFVFQGYNSTFIQCGDRKIPAAVVNNQEKKSGYIFTCEKDEINLGSVWEVKNLHLLITSQITFIKDVKWNKYTFELCNFQLNDDVWGRFIGTEESAISTTLQEKSILFSLQKPILILPKNSLKIGEKVVINNRAWLVEEFDNISSAGVDYYTVSVTTVSKNLEGNVEEKNDTFDTQDIDWHNKEITLITENGYFKTTNSNIKIISRKKDQVVFSIPFGIEEVTIETKEKGEVVYTTYK